MSISISRAEEMYARSEYEIAATDFLSPAERYQVYNDLIARIGNGISRCFFWGGCRGAERCTAVFLPDWYMPENSPHHVSPQDEERTEAFSAHLAANPNIMAEIPIAAIRIVGSGFKSLTHRDFMGAILSLGIDRSVVGDIVLLSESEALVFVLTKIAPYIVSELTKIGRDGVKTEITNIPPTYILPRRFEDISITVTSPRLDGVVKAITQKSRECAAELVKEGMVQLSYADITNISANVKKGDVISIRGYGKYLIGEVSGSTRSGKLRIACKKYI